MTTRHLLAVRTQAALGRLATLQKRADRAGAEGLVQSVLKEFSRSLQDLQVATEELNRQSEDSVILRGCLQEEQARLREIVQAMPVACVWTSAAGEIENANPAAADLLNVSAQHLIGRPLVLFTVERARFTESLAALNDGLTDIVDVSAVLRPRERRPQPVRLVGHRFVHDARRCWFILKEPSAALSATSA